jgi:hypothetical protein
MNIFSSVCVFYCSYNWYQLKTLNINSMKTHERESLSLKDA